MKKIRAFFIVWLAVLLMVCTAIPAHAANTLSSVTGVVVSTAATFNVRGNQGAVQIFLKYGKGDGTSVAISKVEFIVPQLGGTTLYQVPASSTSGTTLGSYTLTLNADGNYIITLGYVPREATSMKITVAFTGGTTQTLQVDAKVDVN